VRDDRTWQPAPTLTGHMDAGVTRSILVPPNDGRMADSATSPFNQPVSPSEQPLAQARDLLTKVRCCHCVCN